MNPPDAAPWGVGGGESSACAVRRRARPVLRGRSCQTASTGLGGGRGDGSSCLQGSSTGVLADEPEAGNSTIARQKTAEERRAVAVNAHQATRSAAAAMRVARRPSHSRCRGASLPGEARRTNARGAPMAWRRPVWNVPVRKNSRRLSLLRAERRLLIARVRKLEQRTSEPGDGYKTSTGGEERSPQETCEEDAPRWLPTSDHRIYLPFGSSRSPSGMRSGGVSASASV